MASGTLGGISAASTQPSYIRTILPAASASSSSSCTTSSSGSGGSHVLHTITLDDTSDVEVVGNAAVTASAGFNKQRSNISYQSTSLIRSTKSTAAALTTASTCDTTTNIVTSGFGIHESGKKDCCISVSTVNTTPNTLTQLRQSQQQIGTSSVPQQHSQPDSNNSLKGNRCTGQDHQSNTSVSPPVLRCSSPFPISMGSISPLPSPLSPDGDSSRDGAILYGEDSTSLPITTASRGPLLSSPSTESSSLSEFPSPVNAPDNQSDNGTVSNSGDIFPAGDVEGKVSASSTTTAVVTDSDGCASLLISTSTSTLSTITTVGTRANLSSCSSISSYPYLSASPSSSSCYGSSPDINRSSSPFNVITLNNNSSNNSVPTSSNVCSTTGSNLLHTNKVTQVVSCSEYSVMPASSSNRNINVTSTSELISVSTSIVSAVSSQASSCNPNDSVDGAATSIKNAGALLSVASVDQLPITISGPPICNTTNVPAASSSGGSNGTPIIVTSPIPSSLVSLSALSSMSFNLNSSNTLSSASRLATSSGSNAAGVDCDQHIRVLTPLEIMQTLPVIQQQDFPLSLSASAVKISPHQQQQQALTSSTTSSVNAVVTNTTTGACVITAAAGFVGDIATGNTTQATTNPSVTGTTGLSTQDAFDKYQSPNFVAIYPYQQTSTKIVEMSSSSAQSGPHRLITGELVTHVASSQDTSSTSNTSSGLFVQSTNKSTTIFLPSVSLPADTSLIPCTHINKASGLITPLPQTKQQQQCTLVSSSALASAILLPSGSVLSPIHPSNTPGVLHSSNIGTVHVSGTGVYRGTQPAAVSTNDGSGVSTSAATLANTTANVIYSVTSASPTTSECSVITPAILSSNTTQLLTNTSITNSTNTSDTRALTAISNTTNNSTCPNSRDASVTADADPTVIISTSTITSSSANINYSTANTHVEQTVSNTLTIISR